jgi:Spy/CpxP family protein refolding chaperone
MVPQQPPPGQHAPMAQPHVVPPVPPHDPLGENLFPPELVMQHKQAIGLTDEQKAAIRDELLKASTHFNELQFQMQDEMENLVGLTKGATVDEQRVLAQLDKVLSIEREVKRAQMAVSIRIKNKLTPEQQTRLQEIRRGFSPR